MSTGSHGPCAIGGDRPSATHKEVQHPTPEPTQTSSDVVATVSSSGRPDDGTPLLACTHPKHELHHTGCRSSDFRTYLFQDASILPQSTWTAHQCGVQNAFGFGLEFDGMDDETIADFKWLIAGGILALYGEILFLVGGRGLVLVALLLTFLGGTLFVGGFLGSPVRESVGDL